MKMLRSREGSVGSVASLLCVTVCSLFLLQRSVVVAGKQPMIKEHRECDDWAREGECVANPGFMWQSCHAR
jgi:hypothetical protein